MAGRQVATATAAALVLIASTSLAIARSPSTEVSRPPDPGGASDDTPHTSPASPDEVRRRTDPGGGPDDTPVEVTYRVEVRVEDGDGFAELLAATMADPRGWSRADFVVREASDAPFLVVLVEGDEAQQLCLPYDVGGEFSCQNGPVVVINAKRWRAGVEHWPLSLHDYRVMLLNHEMGHLLGQHHRGCTSGEPAPVMYQQSGSLRGCLANPWPTDAEIERAARHDLKLAPAFGE